MTKNRLSLLRNKIGWSSQQVAEYLDISEKLYRDYEDGIIFPDLFLTQPLEELFGESFHYIMENPETGEENFFTDHEIKVAVNSAHSCDGVPMCEHDKKIIEKVLVDHFKKHRKKLYKYQEQFDKNIFIQRNIVKEAKQKNNFRFNKNLPDSLMIFSIKKMMIDGHEESEFLSVDIVPEWVVTPSFYDKDTVAQIQFENYYIDKNLPLPEDKWQVLPQLVFYYEHYNYHFDSNKKSEFISYESALKLYSDYES